MNLAVATLLALAAAAAEPENTPPPRQIVQQLIARLALAQVERPDPSWQKEQRDCAGLVRFVFRKAYTALRPQLVERGLFSARDGRPLHFADAETLVSKSFRSFGRGGDALQRAETGDVLAFRQTYDRDGDVAHHLMLVLHVDGELLVVYHPGDGGDALRIGRLAELQRDAPLEWRPTADNPAFLGFYRFAEWM